MLSTAPLAYISDKVSDSKHTQAIALLRTTGDIGFLFGALGIGMLSDVLGSNISAVQSSSISSGLATAWFARSQLGKRL